MHDHAIPHLDVLHLRANFLDDSAAFVAEQVRQVTIGPFNAINFADL